MTSAPFVVNGQLRERSDDIKFYKRGTATRWGKTVPVPSRLGNRFSISYFPIKGKGRIVDTESEGVLV